MCEWELNSSNEATDKPVFERIINMIIDRERVKNTFAEYTSGYNATDPKIKLKIDHTYRVAELCELIARDLKLDEYGDRCGMAHRDAA